MLIPSFVAFQTARRAMSASMANITVTGNNIANANTENYTRQKVDLSSISGTVSEQYTTGKETVGYGVEVDGISQYRDSFLDARYRDQNSKANQYDTYLSGLEETLSVIDEAETDGLMAQFADFQSQLETYSQSSTSENLALVARTSAESLVEMMNVYSEQISAVRNQAISDLTDVVADNSFNPILKSIADLNDSIRNQEIAGKSPNELYDQRNALIDELSSLTQIRVTTTAEKVSNSVTVNNISISMLDQQTGSYTIPLVSGAQYNSISVVESDETNGAVSIVLNSSFGGNDGQDITNSFASGSIRGYVDLINGEGTYADTGDNEATGTLYYLKSLDTLASNFAQIMNDINKVAATDVDLFAAADGGTTITAGNIKVSDEWLADATKIVTTTSTTTSGSADNLLKMIDALESDVTFYEDPSDPTSDVLYKGTFTGYTSAMVGQLALQVELNQNFSDTANTVLSTLSDDRQEISGVSLDEEGVNLIIFQKAYEAAARYFTALDEAMDTVINRMGVVGL